MPRSNVVQSNFLGGEWSPYAQGRIDDPAYRKAMDTCRNIYPIEEGAAPRRSGFRDLGATRKNMQGITRPFVLPNNIPVDLELTFDNGTNFSWLRFWCQPYAQGGSGICLLADTADTILAISAATPAVVQTSSAQSWATGDTVYIVMDPTQPVTNAPTLQGRQFTITRVDSTHFSLVDAFTGNNVVGSTLSFTAAGTNTINHVWEIKGPYTTLAQVQGVRIVQDQQRAFFLSSTVTPWLLTLTQVPIVGSVQPAFTFVDSVFKNIDGPYLDPPFGASQTLNGIGAVNNNTTTPTFTVSDGSYTFVASDVGRAIRLWSQPAAWNSATNYASGKYVSYLGQYWLKFVDTSIGTSAAGVPPGALFQYTDSKGSHSIVIWALVPTIATWTYGYISAFTNGTTVTLALQNGIDTTDNGTTIDTYRLGVYTAGQFPACGTWHENRLWLGGAVPNRFDACMTAIGTTNVPNLLFSPTDVYGNVADNHGISYILDSPASNSIYWMEPDHSGILVGTAGGEWLIQASAVNDPLTPRSIQAHRVTRYKMANIEPRRTGLALAAVQSYGRRLLEYMSDGFTGRFSSRHLNEFAKHLSVNGISEIAYQEELAPIIWCRNGDGTLTGVTYRRVASFASEPPIFMGWHRHDHGDSRTFESIAVGPDLTGTIDALTAITNAGGLRRVELAMPLFDENASLLQAWMLDGAVIPSGTDAGAPGVSIKFYGMWALAGKTVSVWAAGLDCGDYTVAADGSVTVLYQSDPGGFLTPAYLNSLSSASTMAAQIDVTIASVLTRVQVPVVIGKTFTSQGRVLRPQTPQEIASNEGAGLGKTRRGHMFASHVAGSVVNAASYGTSFSNLYPAAYTLADKITPLATNVLFTGIHQNTLQDDFGFDSALCWQVTRPYPHTQLALSTFIETQER